MRRFAKRRAKLAAEVCRRDMGHCRERRHVERQRELAVHRVRARSIRRLRSSIVRDIEASLAKPTTVEAQAAPLLTVT